MIKPNVNQVQTYETLETLPITNRDFSIYIVFAHKVCD